MLDALGCDVIKDLKRMNKRQVYYQGLNFVMIVTSALMIWKFLMVLTGSPSPIVVVLSGSMEPAFYRGDLLVLTNFSDPVRVGDIPVFKLDERDIPIVHRVIRVHDKADGSQKILTQGDNNNVDDRGLYATGQDWIEPRLLLGRAKAFVPYIGMVTIIMNDFPIVKYIVLGTLAIFVLVQREA